MLWNYQNNLTFFPLSHPSVLSHRHHCPPGFASGWFHLLPSQACFLNEKCRKEWVLCLANKTLPSLVLCPHSENTGQRQLRWASFLRIYEQDHNSLPCLFPKDFLGHFLIQSGTTFDFRLNFIHWTVWYPRFTKSSLEATADLVTHIHTSTSRNSFTFTPSAVHDSVSVTPQPGGVR